MDGIDILVFVNDIGEFFFWKVKDIYLKLEISSLLFFMVDFIVLCSVDVLLMEFNIFFVDDVRKLIFCLVKKFFCLDFMLILMVV